MEKKTLYRVLFMNNGKMFDVYARQVSQGSLFGFVEIEDLVFGEKSALLVDPTEDALRQEFEFTKRIYIPLHSVIRIEEVDKSTAGRPRIVAIRPEDKTSDSKEPIHMYTPPFPGKS
ncbi:MAG: DUF1820 family protein [Spirochaetia bacterium]|nr:DUF1820 family protein [Spirochaetia bacterium]